jgi:WD40 repeat protein
MRLGTLLPFAALGVLIVVVSSAALLSSTGGGLPLPASQATPTLPAEATQRAVPELSRTARLAYWRDGRLWISGLDGSLRRTLTPLDEPRRATHMRWSPDGDKIAFLDSGLSIVVVHVDGRRWDVSLPLVLRDQGWRIADVRWSPDSTRIASTFLQPGDGRADAFIVDLTPALKQWQRITEMNDLFVADWVSNTELLAGTAGGVIALIEVPTGSALPMTETRISPLSGALGTSPVIASDGRVHFLAGRVPTSRDPSLPYITASRASVWSTTLDGSDVRRETLTELNDVRLDARLPDGRYLVHRGGVTAQSVTGDAVESLPTNAGLIQRLRLAPDGRTAYGFTRERIVQLDITKVGLTPPASPDPSATVFLDTSGEADVWFPAPPVRRAASPAVLPATGPPAVRYAFTLAGHLWSTAGSERPELLRAGQALRRTFLPTPRWSPGGTHLFALEQAGFGAPTTALVGVVVDAEGEQIRLADSYAAARSFAWAPDGKEIAVVVDRRGVNGTATSAVLEVRFLDTSGKVTRTAIPGTEVAWTSAGVLVMTELAGHSVVQLVQDRGGIRTFVERAKLVDHPDIASTPWLGGAWSGLDATPDGAWTSVRITTAEGTSGYVVLLDARGDPVEFVRAEDLSDAVWSPAKPLIGYTLDVRTVDERAVVHEPGNGPITFQEGRFSGWSPDGEWYYVARTTGLFAYPLNGGAAVRIGPVAVPMAITALP